MAHSITTRETVEAGVVAITGATAFEVSGALPHQFESLSGPLPPRHVSIATCPRKSDHGLEIKSIPHGVMHQDRVSTW